MERKNKDGIQTDLLGLKKKFEGKSKQIIFYLVIGLILCPFITGMIGQYLQGIWEEEQPIILLNSFRIGLKGIGLLFSAVLYVGWMVGGFRVYMTFYHDFIEDDDGDFQTSKSGEYGRSHFQTEEERKENFKMKKDPYELRDDILGYDEKKYLYAINDQKIKGLNKNKVICGPSGSGKSAAMAIPMIYQNIIRGHSVVVTDSKGDLYKDTCHLAIKHGYTMRVLNLKSGEIKNSDGVDLLKMLKNRDDSDAKAEVLANIIIENSGDGHMDYFAINEMNLLKAIILLVIKPDYVSRGKDNLAEVYNICAHNTPNTLAAMFNMLDDDDPAKEAFSIYDHCNDQVKGQILNGMSIRLGKLSNKYLKQVISNDEIDLLLPMKKKCIYYVVISDMDTAYKFIATLFFSELFVLLSEYADSMTKEQRKKRIPVNFILDEYKNTGAIPNMDQIASTIRSRGMSVTLFLQNIEQLESMYPDLWETILENISIKILLKAGGYSTAEWFSKNLGTKTIRVINRRENRNSMEILEGYDNYQATEGKGERELMKPAELMNELSENDLIITISSRHPVKLKKYLDFMHPMYEEAKEKEMLAKKHLPKWRKRLQDKEKAETETKWKEQQRIKIEQDERKREEKEIEDAIKERERKKYSASEKKHLKKELIKQEEKKRSAVPDYIELEEEDIPAIEISEVPKKMNNDNGWVSKWVLEEDEEEETGETKEENASDQALHDLFG